jgi:hypothetical protein
LCGSYMVLSEMNIFRRAVSSNERWLRDLIDLKMYDYARDDFESFLSNVDNMPYFERTQKSFLFWKRSAWEISFKQFTSFKFVSLFRRIEQILISYALETTSESKLNWLSDKLRLCRTSRCITLVLLFTGIEITFPILLHPSGVGILQREFVYAAMLLLAVFITVQSYKRFCDTLFAVVYIRYSNYKEDIKTASTNKAHFSPIVLARLHWAGTLKATQPGQSRR